jgi:hypothetical protein
MKHVINSLTICGGFSRENARIALVMFFLGKLNIQQEKIIIKLDEHPNDDRRYQKEDAEIMNPLNLSITQALNVIETGSLI